MISVRERRPRPPTTKRNGGGGGEADKKKKKDKQEACKRAAQAKFDEAKKQALHDAARAGVLFAGATVGVQAGAGCALGAGVGAIIGGLATAFMGGEEAFGGAPVGCFTGAVSAVLDGLPVTFAVAVSGGGIDYKLQVNTVNQTLQNDLQACSQL